MERVTMISKNTADNGIKVTRQWLSAVWSVLFSICSQDEFSPGHSHTKAIYTQKNKSPRVFLCLKLEYNCIRHDLKALELSNSHINGLNLVYTQFAIFECVYNLNVFKILNFSEELNYPKDFCSKSFDKWANGNCMQLIAINQTLKPLCLYLCYTTILGTILLNSRTLVFIWGFDRI